MKIKTIIPHFVDNEGKILKDSNGNIVTKAGWGTELREFIYLKTPSEIMDATKWEGEGVDDYYESISHLSDAQQLIEMVNPLATHKYEVTESGIYRDGVECLFYTVTNALIRIDEYCDFKGITTDQLFKNIIN